MLEKRRVTTTQKKKKNALVHRLLVFVIQENK